MALNVAALITTYQTEYQSNAEALASLPPVDFSDQGRSISGASARESLQRRQEWLEQKLAQLGAPVGTIGVPFQIAEVIR